MIIDFHTHIFPSFFRNERTLFFPEEPAFKLIYRSPKSRLVGRKELLKNMDQEGIHKSVIFGFPWQKPDHFRRHNDYIIESVQHHPDRLIGFCCFAPQSPRHPKRRKDALRPDFQELESLLFMTQVYLPVTLSPSRISWIHALNLMFPSFSMPTSLWDTSTQEKRRHPLMSSINS